MLVLHNPVHPYAWGSHDGIAAIVGSAPTGGPEAELWVGTHPRGPSVVVGGEHDSRTLADVIGEDPARWLGPELAAAGHTALPFLLKILAIGQPLSLQAHPSADQARTGFAREDAAGVPVDAATRNYRDASPKPEALVALTATWALCGFRPPVEAANLLAGLGIEAFDPLIEALASGGTDGIRTVLGWLLRLDGSAHTAIADQVAASVARVKGDDLDDPRVWVRRLVHAFPGDPTAVAPLLLNVVRMDPGEAVHLPAGNLHAYLDGAGVEIMAASDNVLRGGLTPKHIDVGELLAVLRFEPGVPAAPRTCRLGGGITTYDAAEDAFALAVVDAEAETGSVIEPTAPSLLLATGGTVTIAGPDGEVAVGHGDAAFAAPGSGPYRIAGSGRLWWGTTGAGLPG
jgi:mannose-6-phosphate isomerase